MTIWLLAITAMPSAPAANVVGANQHIGLNAHTSRTQSVHRLHEAQQRSCKGCAHGQIKSPTIHHGSPAHHDHDVNPIDASRRALPASYSPDHLSAITDLRTVTMCS